MRYEKRGERKEVQHNWIFSIYRWDFAKAGDAKTAQLIASKLPAVWFVGGQSSTRRFDLSVLISVPNSCFCTIALAHAVAAILLSCLDCDVVIELKTFAFLCCTNHIMLDGRAFAHQRGLAWLLTKCHYFVLHSMTSSLPPKIGFNRFDFIPLATLHFAVSWHHKRHDFAKFLADYDTRCLIRKLTA